MQTLKLKSHLIKLSKNDRLFNLEIPILGLTGGIACGKSTVANLFREISIPVIDADKLIHQIYALPASIQFIQKLCPTVVENNSINFPKLRKLFFNDNELKQKVMRYLFQHLPQAFLTEFNKLTRPPFIIYEVPLLFERQLESKMDQVITVYIPREMQIERLMQRDSTDRGLAQKILDHQMDIELKAQKADFVLPNTGNLSDLKTKFQELIAKICQ